MNLYNNLFTGNIHSIETFGTFDGPGVRYVLFLQGCPFQCQYCHNRDTWSTEENKRMTVEEVLHDFERYSHFYKNGGITVSGGEALLQIGFITELFKKAKERNIHTCLDTSAGCYNEKQIDLYKTLLSYTDLVLLDIKHIDDDEHMKLTKSSNKHVLKFASLLSELKVDTVIRHVLIPTINDQDIYLNQLRSFLDRLNNVKKIEVLPYHKKGIAKWEAMGLTYELKHIEEPTQEMIKKAEFILTNNYHFIK
jgi:pyruvate formate lyase activating enzyme